MAESTTRPAASPLASTLFTLLEAHRPACRQERPFQRLVALALGAVCALGRHTITQLLIVLGLTEADWSGFYRLFNVPRLDYDRLCQCFLRQTVEHVPTAQPYVVALDGVQIARQSRTMPGTSWLKDPHTPPFFPGIHRAQRVVAVAWLVPRSAAGDSRAIPVRVETACGEKAVRPAGMEARTEWAAGLAGLHGVRAQLDAAGRPEQLLLAIADGHYSNQHVWQGLPERTVLLARCARNRALYALPAPRSGRGRPRKYGERAPTPAAWLAERTGWRRVEVLVRGRVIPLTYRVEGPYLVKGAPEQPLYLLVVRGVAKRSRRQKRRAPAFFLVTAVAHAGTWVWPLPAAELLAWAWQRWEVEVTHREYKSGFGVGEAQCWSPAAALLTVQWAVWVYSLLVLTGYRVWGLGPGTVRPPGRWWAGSRRWSLGRLVQALRHELWTVGEFRPAWSRTTGTWGEMVDWLALQTNVLLGTQRI